MPNPLQAITETLAQAAREADVLPASGQATIDEAHADIEEHEDALLSAREHVYDTLWEAAERGGTLPLYAPCPALSREEDHLYRYFMDGSFRSYFLGTLLAQQWESPLTFGQIGACVLRRRDDGSVERELLQARQILAVAKHSDVLWEALEARTAGTEIVLADILEGDQLTPSGAVVDLREKATGKVRWQMHLLEAQVIQECLPRLDGDRWLVADGSLRFTPLQEMLSAGGEVAPVLGIAKNFRRDVRFRYGRGPRAQDLTLYRLLAGLPFAHRTAAFGALKGKVVFWYVRLREQGQMEYPLMGVIKAELINPTGEALPSALIDRLSRALVAERSVTPHGRDRRWHAHLYPIFLAETAVKGSFYSAEVVRSALLWR
ncbi:MAG: hypothetical protein AB7W28_08215 [Armatimonadota bacterium]